ncbi:hypothetical protein Sjap_004967 [Stephania japonica]|uniref:Uncharacterized protein n=1 Tax=Stephania japonica TaxID=461633 RepID=A0AAP0K4J1_9MAGN
MILYWLSQSTTQQPLQKDIQHTIPNLQNSETQVTSILEHLINEEKLSLQPISYLEETVNAATLQSVEFDEFSIMDEYLSKPEETFEVSLHEPNIIIAQNEKDEPDKEIVVISERPEEPQKESKEDQPLVLTIMIQQNHVLEVQNELLNLKESMLAKFPKTVDAAFIVDISKGEDIT